MKTLHNVMVTMRDGIHIALDAHIPDGSGPFPSLFSMSAYGKEEQAWPGHGEIGDVDYFVNKKGYAWVVADSRGKYPSEGQYKMWDKDEQQDGYELVEWTAHQPWCNGVVGGMGQSYFSKMNYLIAATQPPSLKAIIVFGGPFDTYRGICYYGGIGQTAFVSNWLARLQARCYPPPCITPPGKWQPPANCLQDVLKNYSDGPFYDERSISTKIDKVKVPVYQFIAPQIMTHRPMIKAYEALKVPKKLLVETGSGWDFLFDESSKNEQCRWFDYWLKGIDNGIMKEPPVAMYMPGAEEWRFEKEWPLKRTVWTEFYLHTGENSSATEPPYGTLLRDIPAVEENPDSYSYPECARRIEAGLPVAGYCTPPLKEDTEIIGSGSLVIYASSTANDVPWIIRIDDWAPNGTAEVAGFGWLRACHRELDPAKSLPGRPYHTYKKPTLIEPNKIYRYEVEIWPIFRTFKAGHRMRLRIASNDTPSIDGQIAVTFRGERRMTNTIYHSKQYPSHLVLPLVPKNPSPIRERPNITYKRDPLFRSADKWESFHHLRTPEAWTTTPKQSSGKPK